MAYNWDSCSILDYWHIPAEDYNKEIGKITRTTPEQREDFKLQLANAKMGDRCPCCNEELKPLFQNEFYCPYCEKDEEVTVVTDQDDIGKQLDFEDWSDLQEEIDKLFSSNVKLQIAQNIISSSTYYNFTLGNYKISAGVINNLGKSDLRVSVSLDFNRVFREMLPFKYNDQDVAHALWGCLCQAAAHNKKKGNK